VGIFCEAFERIFCRFFADLQAAETEGSASRPEGLLSRRQPQLREATFSRWPPNEKNKKNKNPSPPKMA
jgi:hypothetical protein